MIDPPLFAPNNLEKIPRMNEVITPIASSVTAVPPKGIMSRSKSPTNASSLERNYASVSPLAANNPCKEKFLKNYFSLKFLKIS